jgi:hypothetical protein
MFTLLIPLTLIVQAGSAVVDNDYVRVTRDTAPCASGALPECSDRVVVALGPMDLRSAGSMRKMTRGDFVVFKRGDSYEVPRGARFVEVAIKPNHPDVEAPKEVLPPEKNEIKYDGEEFFIFEERLQPGDTRARHSHSQRVVIQLNRTRLEQLPDGEARLIRDIDADRVGFNPPVVHVVKNVGELPLRGIVIEFKPPPRK